MGSSFPRDGYDDGPGVGFDVAFEVEYLLPSPQAQPAFGYGYGQFSPEKRPLKVRMPIPVRPGLFVAIIATWRNQSSQQFGQVLLEAWFELDHPQRPGASDVEHVGCTGRDPGIGCDLGNLLRDVTHITGSAGLNCDVSLKYQSPARSISVSPGGFCLSR